jgi:hypothetical protein
MNETVEGDDTQSGPLPYADYIASIPADAPYDSAISYVTMNVLATLPLTINELAGDSGASTIAGVIQGVKDFEMTGLSSETTVTFGNLYNVSKVESNVAVGYTMPNATYEMEIDWSIDSISSQTTTIALPEAAETIYGYWYLDSNFNNLTLYYPDAEEYAAGIGEGCLKYPEGDASVYFTYELPDEYTETVEITITSIYAYSGSVQLSGEALAAALNDDLTYSLTISVEENSGMMHTDFQMPELNIA